MARKKKDHTDDRISRFRALRKILASKPKRTLGQLLSLRGAVVRDVAEAWQRLDAILDRIYEGRTGPLKTDPWCSWPRCRRLFLWTGKGRLRMLDFGWSHKLNAVGGGFWVRSWSANHYDGYDDVHLINALTGRRPYGAMDQLVAAAEVAEIIGKNDAALAEEFEAADHRLNQLYQRRSVVEQKIGDAIVARLAQAENWTGEGRASWRRITFEDGTVLTVTDKGEVLFRDALIEVPMSLLDPVDVKSAAFPNTLAERQMRALERKPD